MRYSAKDLLRGIGIGITKYDTAKIEAAKAKRERKAKARAERQAKNERKEG